MPPLALPACLAPAKHAAVACEKRYLYLVD